MFRPKSISLKSAWYGLIVLLTVLPVAVLLPWIGPKAFDVLKQRALLAESQFNENIRDHVEAEISRMVTMLTNKSDPIGYILEGKDYDASLLQALLNKVLQREPSVFTLTLLDAQGRMISGVERHEGATNSITDGAAHALAEDRIDSHSATLVIPLHGRIYIGPTNNKHGSASFHVAVPVGGERPGGVLLADIDAKLFWSAVEDKLARRDVTTYLVNRRGSLLNAPSGVALRKGELLTHLPIVRALLADQEWGREKAYTGLNGEQVFGVVSPVEMLNWGVISEVPTRNITAPIRSMLTMIAFIIIGLMAVGGIAGVCLVNRMSRRMMNLSQAFQAIANGDYNQHLPTSPFTEVAELIAAVNRMSQDLQQREDAVRQSERRLQAILDNSPAVICMKDVTGHYLLVNRCFEELFSVSKSEAEGSTDRDLFPANMAQSLHDNDLQVIHTGRPMEFEEVIHLEDERRTYISVKFPLTESDGRVYAVCSISTDITERMRDEERLEHLAYHDVLTGLANRALFMDRLEHAINLRASAGRKLAVIFMDLDRFKYINDTLGHEIGDQLLKDLAQRLSECLRKSDT
ncbi:MAG: diguanylate cyclase domain-containing protein, partial [Gammaproteobacteria bacterium]